MPEVKQDMKLNSEKKYSIRYDSVAGEKDPPFRAVYLGKIPLLRGRVPSNIRVTVEWDE